MKNGIHLMPLPELRGRGFEALLRELGPANAVRFLGLYHTGSGDYAHERDRWLDGVTMEQAEQEMRSRREGGKT